MKNASLSLYTTALLVGSSLAIVEPLAFTEELRPVGSAGCSSVSCNKCFPTTCFLRVGEYAEFEEYTYENRCVDYDQAPPAHCANFTVSNFRIMDADGFQIGACKSIPCGSGTPLPEEECTDPWR